MYETPVCMYKIIFGMDGDGVTVAFEFEVGKERKTPCRFFFRLLHLPVHPVSKKYVRI